MISNFSFNADIKRCNVKFNSSGLSVMDLLKFLVDFSDVCKNVSNYAGDLVI